MKLLNKNNDEIKLQIENLDDLWYLSNIIDVGDFVKGKTLRKIKLGDQEDRNVKIIRKSVFIEIKVEKIDFSNTILKLLGIITQGPEDIQKGTHHSFNLEENSIITIRKQWLKFQLDKLKEACSEKISSMCIVVHDRESAYFALMKKYGYELLSRLDGDVQKKGEDKKITKNFYKEIIKKLEDYDKKYQFQTIILASPAFWKDELTKELSNADLKKKIIFATCSSAEESAFNEVLKRDEVKNALQQDRVTKEINLVENLLAEIKKNNLAVYGFKDTKNAVDAGAVKNLLITDAFIQKSREQNKYGDINNLMKSTESIRGIVSIISKEHDGGKKLDGLSGIAAILKYKINY
ncbi:MAG: mRNA surveillance protein pelota [Nanoarchaeota archaeon]